MQAVQFAAVHNLTIAVKGGGYSWVNCESSACATCTEASAPYKHLVHPVCTAGTKVRDILQRNLWRADRGLTVDLSAMNAVHVDAANQEISVQGQLQLCMHSGPSQDCW